MRLDASSQWIANVKRPDTKQSPYSYLVELNNLPIKINYFCPAP